MYVNVIHYALVMIKLDLNTFYIKNYKIQLIKNVSPHLPYTIYITNHYTNLFSHIFLALQVQYIVACLQQEWIVDILIQS